MIKVSRKSVRFDKLVKNIVSEESKKTLLRIFAEEIAQSSKNYITQGKVKPTLNDSTLDHRRKRGIVNQKPLFFRRNLRDSIKATDNGISFARYGQLHREGYEVANSAYARYHGFYDKVLKKGRNVPPREFISYEADDKEKEKILRKVKRRFVNEVNKARK
tara:strand:- start:248 stop:730 length:483 start_codon:yes stop_codon:yes gene_type:complete